MILYSAVYKEDAHLLKIPQITNLEQVHEVDQLSNKDSMLLLHGGSDISPTLYWDSINKHTNATKLLSQRDKLESALVDKAVSMGIPIVGICRGAQMLCIKAGGSLIQHVTGHNSSHTITTTEGDTYDAAGDHHQMMFPYDTEYDMIAVSTDNLSISYQIGQSDSYDMPEEPEIVYFPEIKGLAIQPHPEWMKHDSLFVKYYLNLVKELLL